MYRKILALIICLVMVLFVGCGSKKTESDIEVISSSKPQTPTYYTNNLTGENNITDEAVSLNRPVAVMINNISIAQKVQTGIGKADIVYETEVEGGITRLMAVYKDISKVEKIGTIRSARYAYIDLAMGHSAIYIHHGQDKRYAKPHLKDIQTFAISTNNAGERVRNGLASEHTLYGFGKKIAEWFEKKEYSTKLKSPELWQKFADKDTQVSYPESVANTVTVKFSGSYTSVFKYDAESGKYVRYFKDTERKDYYTGESEYFKNVFVLSTAINAYPDGKHMKVDLSKGDGYYCVNGTYTPIKWEKGAADNGFKFTTADGKPLEVNQGNSWVCIHSKKFDSKFE